MKFGVYIVRALSILVFLGFLFISGDLRNLYAGKISVLPELANPYKLKIDDHQLYISEGAGISIYSLKDFHLIKRFGNRGEGPGEFKVNPNTNMGSVQFDIYPDFIVVYSIGRISYFTKHGEFIKEVHNSALSGYYKLLEISNKRQYVGLSTVLKNKTYYSTVNIYDSGLKKAKELYRERFWLSKGKNIDLFDALRGVVFDVSNQMVFIEKEKTSILIFNQKGELINTFTPPIKPLEITPERKSELINAFENTSQFKSFYNRIKYQLKIPGCYPLIRYFQVSGQKLYVLTWKKHREKVACFVYDLKEGGEVDKIYLPLKEINKILLYPYTIDKGRLYQLIENERTGSWELYVGDLENID